VFLAGLPSADPALDDEELLDRWARLRTVRSEVTTAIEDVRRAGKVGHSLDAAVVVRAGGATLELLRAYAASLPEILIVSSAAVEAGGAGDEVTVEVTASSSAKCARCWNRRADVGGDQGHPDICGRCAGVLAAGAGK
jgi:isoleucyl-tRNA synthetase